jgi:putative ABC transport system permease protein
MLSDLRFGARMLARAPATSLAAILTLALGIGANTTIFSVLYGVLLRPLPYPNAERLVLIWQDLRQRGGPPDEWATSLDYITWRAERSVLAAAAAARGAAANLTGRGDAEQVAAGLVSPAYFDVAGVQPALGRAFREEESLPTAPRVVILSDALWKRRYGGDPAILGQTITISGVPNEVVGVMPAGFQPPIVAPRAQLWQPLRINPAAPARGDVVNRVLARLRDGVTLGQASAHMDTVAARIRQQYPHKRGAGIRVEPLFERMVRSTRPAILVLAGAVGLVLLIACANVASLLLARASGRGREMAVRAALGAGRARLIRQLLAESLLLAVIGGGIGVLLAVWGVEALVAASPAGTPRVEAIAVDGASLAFTIALTLATGMLFGLAPALHASRANLTGALREGERGQAGGAGRTLRRALVAAETAIALVLLSGAGLLLRSFVELQAVDRGFDSSNVLTAGVAPSRVPYPEGPQIAALYDRLVEQVRALPGVESAALVSVLPLSGSDTDISFLIDGRPRPAQPGDEPIGWYRVVSSDYFRTMRIRIVRGRALDDTDRAEAPGAIVINEPMAERYWPNDDPIGRRIDTGQKTFTIVGIARGVRHRGPEVAPLPEMYVHYRQYAERGSNIVIRAATDPARLAAPLRDAVRQIDATLPLANVATMEALEADAVATPRFVMLLMGLFAGVALTLALVGVYGVLSYAVAQRTTEIGVRMALGATRGNVLRLVVGDGLRMVGIGAAVGLAAALAAGRAMQRLLFGVGPADPATFAATAALLLIAAAVACWAPGRRATRIDPMEALRYE